MAQHHEILELLRGWQLQKSAGKSVPADITSRLQKLHLTFVSGLLNQLSSLEPSLLSTQSQDCVFMADTVEEVMLDAFIAPQGKRSGNSGLYLSFRPGQSFIGLGYLAHTMVNRFAIAQEKKLHYEELEYMVHFLTTYCGFESLMGTTPEDTPAKSSLINLGVDENDLRPWLLFKYIPHEELLDSQLEQWLIEQYGLLLSYNQYLNRALNLYAHVTQEELEDYVDLP